MTTCMRCPNCAVDLGTQKTITAIQGLLICNDCAKVKFSEQELLELSEEVVPADISIEPAKDGLVCPYCHKNYSAAKVHTKQVLSMSWLQKQFFQTKNQGG